MTSEKLPGFLESEIGLPDPKDSLFHVIPVPYEATVSYGGGTSNGPEAILEASQQLEIYDGEGTPGEHGIFTREPIDCTGDAETVLNRIEQVVGQVLELEKIPVLLGGEHTVTLGALRSLQTRYGEFGVVQFDAHADLRDTYEGTPYSHACVMRRALDLDLQLFQIGVRALSPKEVELREKMKIGRLDARELATSPMPDIILPEDFPNDIYITFDVDGLDPSVIPATGTPEPGGLNWWQAMLLLDKLAAERTVIGMDVVELAPMDNHHVSNFAAARLAYNMMGFVSRSDALRSGK